VVRNAGVHGVVRRQGRLVVSHARGELRGEGAVLCGGGWAGLLAKAARGAGRLGGRPGDGRRPRGRPEDRALPRPVPAAAAAGTPARTVADLSGPRPRGAASSGAPAAGRRSP